MLQECSLGEPLPKLPKGSGPLNKIAARAKNRKNLKPSAPRPLAYFQNNFTGIFLG